MARGRSGENDGGENGKKKTQCVAHAKKRNISRLVSRETGTHRRTRKRTDETQARGD